MQMYRKFDRQKEVRNIDIEKEIQTERSQKDRQKEVRKIEIKKLERQT